MHNLCKEGKKEGKTIKKCPGQPLRCEVRGTACVGVKLVLRVGISAKKQGKQGEGEKTTKGKCGRTDDVRGIRSKKATSCAGTALEEGEET